MWKNENKQKDARIGPFLELMHTYKAKTKTLIFVYYEAHLLSGPTPRPSPPPISKVSQLFFHKYPKYLLSFGTSYFKKYHFSSKNCCNFF